MKDMEDLIVVGSHFRSVRAASDLDQPSRSQKRHEGLVRTVGGGIASAAEWLFGLVTLVVGLSVLAALPLLQFLSLGYFLESSARVARSGRLRDGFVGVRRAARIGGVVLGTLISLVPLWLVESYARSAALIDPGGAIAHRFRIVLWIVIGLTFFQIAIAMAQGGRLRHFLWPPGTPFWLAHALNRGGLYTRARDGFWSFFTALRLPHYFRLGLLGFLGTLAWIVVPASLIAASGHPVLGVLGRHAFGLRGAVAAVSPGALRRGGPVLGTLVAKLGP
jgi:hypothetical protein